MIRVVDGVIGFLVGIVVTIILSAIGGGCYSFGNP